MSPDTTTTSSHNSPGADDPHSGVVGTESSAIGSLPASGADTEPLACVSCRARKLKCNRIKPACSRCVKVDSPCVYPESRRKPTVKRRNVKELEARLAQVEDYLKEVSKDAEVEVEVDLEEDLIKEQAQAQAQAQQQPRIQDRDFAFATDPTPLEAEIHSVADFNADAPLPDLSDIPDLTSNGTGDDVNYFADGQLMGLGLTESLPPMEMIEELHGIYFGLQHSYLPIVHPGRYLEAFYGPPTRKPPMCLQYAIWAQASYLNDKYGQYADVFYLRARQYADADEMKGYGEELVTISHAQAYLVLGGFEAKSMRYTRASFTTAKCVRLVQMMGLDCLDGPDYDVLPILTPAKSWTELEERRRTFWGAYAIDAHGSIASGAPSLINCDEITTKLPVSEDAYVSSREEDSVYLDESLTGAQFSGFAATIVTCRTFKSIMRHVHRTRLRDRPDDLMNGEFWVRHRKLDNELTSLFMFLPEKLRIPSNLRDPTALHINLNLHAAVICLHHAAIEQAEAYGHGDAVKKASLCRLRATAEEVASIIRLSSHNSGMFKSPLSSLSMYCASSVYVYMAREDGGVISPIDRANLEVIIQAMDAIGRSHRVTQAFLRKACLDVEVNGLSEVRLPGRLHHRDFFPGVGSNISLLTRVTAGMQSSSSILHGRLDLGKSQDPWPALQCRSSEPRPGTRESDGITHCFRAILGAVTRSVNPDCRPHQRATAWPMKTMADNVKSSGTNATKNGKNIHNTHKRRRVGPSPGPEEQFMASNGGGVGCANNLGNVTPSSMSGSGVLNNFDQLPAQVAKVAATLPDRTNSSTSSSPMNHISIGTETRTHTQSSHTSPGIDAAIGFGLGNTPEENRIDLRALQDRISTPFWDQEILDSMAAGGGPMHPNFGGDPWGMLGAELNWDGEVMSG